MPIAISLLECGPDRHSARDRLGFNHIAAGFIIVTVDAFYLSRPTGRLRTDRADCWLHGWTVFNKLGNGP